MDVLTGEELPLPDLADAWPIAVSRGVVYASIWMEQSYIFRAWTLDGERILITPPESVGGDGFRPEVLWPLGDGFGFLADGLSGSFDGENWTVALGPAHPIRRYPMPDGRAMVLAARNETAGQWLVEEDGDWWLAGDPCGESAFSGWSAGRATMLEGRLVHAQWQGFGESVDTDGDGWVEQPLWVTDVGRP